MIQTLFWVIISLAFCAFIWFENDGGNGKADAIRYISAYLLEWSLSIDNIFVFIIIFSAFSVKEKHYGRVLLIGILMAIVFRIIFISVGVALVERFEWILYIFGLFLLYTGFKMFTATDDEEFKPQESIVYKFLQKIFQMKFH